jgi:hypothetical protein
MITELAKDKINIKHYQEALKQLDIEYKDILDKMRGYNYQLNKVLFRRPENLHFYDEEDACMYFDELVCDNAWDGCAAIDSVLSNCYINDALYKPVYLQAEFDVGNCCIKMERV